MKLNHVVALLVLVAAFAGSVQAQKKGSMGKQAILLPAEKLQWESMGDEFPGVMIARLYGDMMKGSYGVFVKLPPGFQLPLHFHRNDEWGVVVSGSLKLGLKGEKEITFGPGSFILTPRAVQHTTSAGPEGCVFLEESNAKEETVMVGSEGAK